MVFESPIWLVGLLPWVALILYLLPGKAQPRAVTFMSLWNSARNSTVGRSRRLPPVSTLLILLSLLLALLSAGKPTITSKIVTNQSITIILDRGASMALPSVAGNPFRGVIEKCQQRTGPLAQASHVTLITLPGEKIETTGDRWVGIATTLSPTVVHTQINQAVVNRLHEDANEVFVLSNQPMEIADSRVFEIAPEAAEQCVAITAFGARSRPRPQVYVRLENHSALQAIKLTIRAGSTITQRQVTLAPMGKSSDTFVDLPTLDRSVTAEIDSDPDKNPWARAWLVRNRPGIKLIQEGHLPASVQQMMRVYASDRPSADTGQAVVISTHALSVNQSGIWIDSKSANQTASGSLSIQAHPLTQDIKSWPVSYGDRSPPDGFTSIVSSGDRVLLAVRDSSARQIWINADLESWRETTDFVIFFANAFEWLGGEPIYAAISGGQPDKPWPGIYGSIAVNAGEVPEVNHVQKQDGASAMAQIDGRQSIASGLLLCALTCLGLSMILY